MEKYYDKINGESSPMTWDEVLETVRQCQDVTHPDDICIYDDNGNEWTHRELCNEAGIKFPLYRPIPKDLHISLFEEVGHIRCSECNNILDSEDTIFEDVNDTETDELICRECFNSKNQRI